MEVKKAIRNIVHPSNRNNVLECEIHDIPLCIVNSLRRVILSEIPNVCMHFDHEHEEENDIKILVNTTPMNNEIIGRRMALIPICVHPNDLEDIERYKFTLAVQNQTPEIIDVTTKDINVYDEKEDRPLTEEERDRMFPPSPITGDYILIAKLLPNRFNIEQGDTLAIEGHASVGTAMMNASYSPVSCATYFNIIDEEAATAALKSQLDALPQPVSDKQRRDIRRRFKTSDIYRSFVKNKYDEPSAFQFKVESECAMSPEYIVFKGLKIICDKLDKIREDLEFDVDQDEPRTVDTLFVKDDNETPEGTMYQLLLHGETETTSNLIDSLLYKRYYQTVKPAERVLLYTGNYCPHPLEKLVVIRMLLRFEDPVEAKRWMVTALQEMREDIGALCKQWIKLTKLKASKFNEVAVF
jgi:DNA-directed RNA polymerase subunit L